jgi:hypothetical protein
MSNALEQRRPLQVVLATFTPEDDPMLNANPNLLFFAYLAIVAILCPICERIANH